MKARLWKISFFGRLYAEKHNENNRYCFIFPKFVWVAVLGADVKRKEEGQNFNYFYWKSFNYFWVITTQQEHSIVGSCRLRAKANISAGSASSFYHLFLMCSRTWSRHDPHQECSAITKTVLVCVWGGGEKSWEITGKFELLSCLWLLEMFHKQHLVQRLNYGSKQTVKTKYMHMLNNQTHLSSFILTLCPHPQ